MIASVLNTLNMVLPFVIAITILVFVHELGHFWIARRNGVVVDIFSIGFGPELFGFTDRHGTRWRISPFPFGGYVKFKGDADASSSTIDHAKIATMSEEEQSQTLNGKTPAQKIAIAFAGPAANYLFAFVLLFGLYFMKGDPIYDLQIAEVVQGQNADKAGLKVSDVIVAVDEKPVFRQQDLLRHFASRSGQDVYLTIKRQNGSETDILTIKAPLYQIKNQVKEKSKLGIALFENIKGYKPLSIVESAMKAGQYCYNLSVSMLSGIASLIMGKGGELGGIGSIGVMAKQSLESGWVQFVMFLTILSINLGLVNLFPLPVLDGGTILLSFIEQLRGKPLSNKIQERIFMVGLLVVGSLMLYTTLSDLIRFRVIQNLIDFFK